MKEVTEEILKEMAERAKNVPVYPNPNFPPSLYYRFLFLLAKELKPEVSVELGVSGGGGSLHLCMGSPGGISDVIGVDYAWDTPENIKFVLDRFPGKYHFQLSDSIAAAPMIHDLYGDVDILFIDTDHTLKRTLDEFNAYKPFLSPNAVVCFDDLFRVQMDGVWEKIPGNKIRLDFLHDGSPGVDGGFGVAWGFE